MKLNEVCAPLISDYLDSTFGDVNVDEKTATCDDCVCSKACRGDLPFYRKDLKCCTFHPYLPNYAVGALLDADWVSVEMKNTLISKIKNREYALPMGIFVPLTYQVKFNNRNPSDFGNKEEFLCPYYDQGHQRCGIWKYRGAVCTSYFCTSDRGDEGLRFWELLGDYLHVGEMVFAQDCIVSMGLSPESIDAQLEYINCQSGTPEELSSNSMSEALFKHHWMEWDGDIIEFYRGCFKYISSLDVAQIGELIRGETADLEEELKTQIQLIMSSEV